LIKPLPPHDRGRVRGSSCFLRVRGEKSLICQGRPHGAARPLRAVARLPFRGERSSLGTRASDVLGWERAGGGRRERTFPSRLPIRDENYVPAIVSIAADRNSRDTADTRLPEPDEIRPMAGRSRSASSRRFGEAAEYRSRERRESAARTRSSLASPRRQKPRGGEERRPSRVHARKGSGWRRTDRWKSGSLDLARRRDKEGRKRERRV